MLSCVVSNRPACLGLRSSDPGVPCADQTKKVMDDLLPAASGKSCDIAVKIVTRAAWRITCSHAQRLWSKIEMRGYASWFPWEECCRGEVPFASAPAIPYSLRRGARDEAIPLLLRAESSPLGLSYSRFGYVSYTIRCLGLCYRSFLSDRSELEWLRSPFEAW